MNQLKGIKIHRKQGGLNEIIPMITGYGIGFKLFNKQLISKCIESVKKHHIIDGYEIKEIHVYHKKYSPYKWLTIKCDQINSESNDKSKD